MHAEQHGVLGLGAVDVSVGNAVSDGAVDVAGAGSGQRIAYAGELAVVVTGKHLFAVPAHHHDRPPNASGRCGARHALGPDRPCEHRCSKAL